MKPPKQNRRKFIQTSSAGLLGTGLSAGNLKPGQSGIAEEPQKIRKYNTLGRTGFQVSDLGFGFASKPSVIKAAINAGVNYLDTARNYGQSEADIGKVIGEFDRDSVFINTKYHSRNLKSREDVLLKAQNSLEKLQVDYVDCYMLQAAQSCDMVKSSYFHDAFDQLKAEGKVKWRGIACHGKYLPGNPEDTMENILMCAIEDGRFDLLLVVYNFLHSEQGTRVLKAAKEKNIATTVMKCNPVKTYYDAVDHFAPLKEEGKEIPEKYVDTMKKFEQFVVDAQIFLETNGLESNDEKLRDIAIKFILENQDVDCALINFTNFSELEVHLDLSGKTLSADENSQMAGYRHVLNPFYCRHGCNECESSCPYEVPVNTIMRYNYYFREKGTEKLAMRKYHRLGGGSPESCIKCPGHCAKACPYGVAIEPLLALAHQNLSFNA